MTRPPDLSNPSGIAGLARARASDARVPGARVPGARVLIVADPAVESVRALRTSTRQLVSAARQLGDASGGEVHVLVVGDPVSAPALARDAAALRGVSTVWLAETAGEAASGAEAMAVRIARMLACAADCTHDYTHVLAADSGACRIALSRVAAQLGVEPVTGVTGIVAADTFVRPIYAGNALLTVRSHDSPKFLCVRAAGLAPAEAGGGAASAAIMPAPGEDVSSPSPSSLAGLAQRLERQCALGRAGGEGGKTAPPLDSARIVVAGGRGLGSAENFTALLAPLAARLGAALGASYGAVSAGYAANALQIGQTGRIIAPELYIAVGISGAIQHLAGIREARIVVAIDRNPEAPIFQAADYGLVADLFEAVPALTRALDALGDRA